MCHNLYVHTIDWDIHVDIENTTRRVSVDIKLTRLRERLLERFDMRSRSPYTYQRTQTWYSIYQFTHWFTF